MSEPLSSLSAVDMRAIASAIRAGRLSPPLSELALEPYLGQTAGSVAPILMKLTTEGLSGDHLAFFLDLLANERESQHTMDNAIELVATGPEAAGLPARDTRIVVRELFRQADRSVAVAGYAVYQGRDVFSVLAERMDAIPQLVVRMYLDVQRPRGDTSRPSEILRRFADRFKNQEWPGLRLPEVYYDPRALQTGTTTRTSLHAKCVVIDERTAFVSSANFTEAAQLRNIEVGALIRIEAFAQQLARHFGALAEQHLLERLPGF